MFENRVSSGITVIMQGIFVCFFALYIILLLILIHEPPVDLTGYVVLFFAIAMPGCGLLWLFCFADVYVTKDQVIYKKFLFVKKEPLETITSIGEGFLPLYFYIRFNNNRKVYFQLKPEDALKRLTEKHPETVLKEFKKIFRLIE